MIENYSKLKGKRRILLKEWNMCKDLEKSLNLKKQMIMNKNVEK